MDANKTKAVPRIGGAALANSLFAELARARWSWRTAVLGYVGMVFCLLAGAFMLIVLIDPFDSGRMPSLLGPGVSDGDPRTANISRGRDPRFNAAIFGNSRAMLLDPARLNALTGFKFVHLTTPSSGAREQVTLLRYFSRLHEGAAAIVMLDPRWCWRDPAITPQVPFPFELYGDDVHYFSSLLNSRAVVKAYKRVMLAFGKLPATDPSGYIDFETTMNWTFNLPRPERAVVDLAPTQPADPPFPAIDLVDRALSELPQLTAVVLFWPPLYYTELPDAGSKEAREIAGCKYLLAQRSAPHRNWRTVDFLLDTPMSRDPVNFLDAGHFRQATARVIERRIGAAILDIRQNHAARVQ